MPRRSWTNSVHHRNERCRGDISGFRSTIATAALCLSSFRFLPPATVLLVHYQMTLRCEKFDRGDSAETLQRRLLIAYVLANHSGGSARVAQTQNERVREWQRALRGLAHVRVIGHERIVCSPSAPRLRSCASANGRRCERLPDPRPCMDTTLPGQLPRQWWPSRKRFGPGN
jgi:hypothetical protein